MQGVDLACLVPAADLGLMESWPRLKPEADALDLADLVDLLAGGAGCLALLRRRRPASLALILSALPAMVVSIGGAAALVATFSVAIRRAEADQRSRIVEARRLERDRLAREMHDVLAHRMSLLSDDGDHVPP